MISMHFLKMRLVSAAAAAFLTVLAPGQAPPTPPTPPESAADSFLRLYTGARSFLGVGVSEVTPARAKELKLNEERGVEVTRVENDGAAEKAGVQKGDVVLEYQGQRIEGTEQFVRLVRETPAGRVVKMLISRGGATQTLTATIGSSKGLTTREGSFRLLPRFEVPEIWMPDFPRINTTYRTSLGIEAESIESQLAQFFGVKEGVLVRSVIKDSAAEKAGFKAGDVITRVEKTEVSSPREVSSAVRRLRAQKSFPISVVRDRNEITLSVTIETEEGRTPARPGRMAINFVEFEF